MQIRKQYNDFRKNLGWSSIEANAIYCALFLEDLKVWDVFRGQKACREVHIGEGHKTLNVLASLLHAKLPTHLPTVSCNRACFSSLENYSTPPKLLFFRPQSGPWTLSKKYNIRIYYTTRQQKLITHNTAFVADLSAI
ncbi:hypothetical protein ACLOJK_015781 [Asimina triloba]